MASPPRPDEVIKDIFIAWRLFRWDRNAVALIDDSREDALRSFWCAVVILPLVFANWALQAATPDNAPGSFGVLVERGGLGRTLTVQAIFYVIRWTAWPVLMHWLAAYLGSGRYFLRYLVAYNWSAAIVAVLTLAYAVVNYSGVLAGEAMVLVSLGILSVMWAYHWFILRSTLEVNGALAAVLVAAHFLVSVIIDGAGTATVT